MIDSAAGSRGKRTQPIIQVSPSLPSAPAGSGTLERAVISGRVFGRLFLRRGAHGESHSLPLPLPLLLPVRRSDDTNEMGIKIGALLARHVSGRWTDGRW